MKVKVLKRTTLTVEAGQEIEIVDSEFNLLHNLGRVEKVEETDAPKKKTGKRAK